MFFRLMAVVCLGLAIGAVFFASSDQLAKNGGVRNRHGGDLFAGLALYFGESVARALVGSVLLMMAWLFWRLSVKRREGP
jgi:hypothetical protein